MSPTLRFPMPVRAVSLLMGLLLAVGLLVAPTSTPKAEAAISAGTGVKAVRVAAAQKGIGYTYGGASPAAGFDCSGLTRYAFAKIGKRIPRTAQQQYNASYKIAKRYARPGDLVFFGGSSRIYHVGVYAGNGYIWHSPRPGKSVAKVKIWTSAVKYARVR